jgi:hypothetical protein
MDWRRLPMLGERLHDFDLRLCRNVLDNVRCNLDFPGFAGFARGQIEPPVWAYLQALGDYEWEPGPRLLNDDELGELASAFRDAPWRLDRPWVPYEPLHRRHIECVREIRDALAAAYAEQWARSSARWAAALEREGTRLSQGIGVVREWVEEVRRLLGAMGATGLLPRPEGSFPTPTFPAPPPAGAAAPTAPADEGRRGDDGLGAAVAETLSVQRELRDLLLSQRTVKEYYTTAEAAGLLGKAEFTVREWCRLGRVHALKKGSGRGKHPSWVIAHAELLRIQREGLLPTKR